MHDTPVHGGSGSSPVPPRPPAPRDCGTQGVLSQEAARRPETSAGGSEVRAVHTIYRPLAEIELWGANPKAHDLDGLIAAFERYGFISPLIVNDATGVLLAGHGRYLALQRMRQQGRPPPEGIGVEADDWLVPTISGISLDEWEAMSYALDDNLSTLAGGKLTFAELSRAFNQERLAEILGELEGASALPVFAQREDFRALQEALLEVERELPEEDFDVEGALKARATPRVRPGQIWELGPHRVMWADSTNPGHMARLMDGELARLVATDPPYGVDLDPSRWLKRRLRRRRHRPIRNDDLKGEELLSFLSAAFAIAADHSTEDASWYVWHACTTRPIFVRALEAAGVRVHQEIVWVKESFQVGHADYHWQHESCLYGWRKRHHFYGRRDQATVWQVPRDREGRHPAAKPVELFVRPMRNNLRRGELALDMFLGAGPALIAAEMLGRRCYGVEIEAQYCQVAIERWEGLTGRKARLLDERR